MGRKTKHNDLTSEELLSKVLPENIQLMNDFLMYLESTGRAPSTLHSYKNDCEIFFCWCLQHANNKFFVDLNKRDIVAFQNFLLHNNENSPARVRRLKSTLSSLSNYISNVMDDVYPNYRPIVKAIESPINVPTREKTILSDEQCKFLLDILVENGKYEQACFFALGIYSGRRKQELLRFREDFFRDEYIVYGSLYRSPIQIKTKGRGINGKMLHVYVLAKQFKPYYDLWMKQREELGINSEWLFPDKKDPTKHKAVSTADSWAENFSKILGVPAYIHSYRHKFVSYLSANKIPRQVIQYIIGWSSDLCDIYDDNDKGEILADYFCDGEFVSQKQGNITDL